MQTFLWSSFYRDSVSHNNGAYESFSDNTSFIDKTQLRIKKKAKQSRWYLLLIKKPFKTALVLSALESFQNTTYEACFGKS